MISMETSLKALEQCQHARVVGLECYLAAIKNVAQYAIELDDEITAPHRKYLNTLAGEVASGEPDLLIESRATFRGLLRDYRDKAAQYLNKLREELSDTARALQEILDSLADAEGDQESQLRAALRQIRELARASEARAVSAALMAQADTIEQTIDEVRKQHQLTVSEFLAEIRTLHKRIEALESAAAVDSLTKLFTRREMEERIRRAAAGGFGLLLVRVWGLRAAESEFSGEVVAQLAGAFVRRLRNSLPLDAVIGRWNEEEFVAILSADPRQAATAADSIAANLSGKYACLQEGRTVRPSLRVRGVGVDSRAGETADELLKRAGEALEAG